MAYGFFLCPPLDLLTTFPTLDTLAACTNVVKVVSFTLLNQKMIYNRQHQPLFMKVRKWAILLLYKKYSIPSIVGVTKKLTQQYIGPFYIVEKVGCLVYKLDISPNWRIYLVFSMAQLELVSPPIEDSFVRLFLSNPLFIFIEGNINNLKSFEIKRVFNLLEGIQFQVRQMV